ncbi:MAG: hypothetical protein QS748_12830 [Candidatus Endonucleobacter bathymodioli]|uniref:Transposase n=1 Tax=Candidatus Endonucleibacter bathymodioli TaxID=539814 RepID=A0AA90NNT8_9GAMM|nr:hypothetical protein [Candidatus Endonucleobacter bathymodioli]
MLKLEHLKFGIRALVEHPLRIGKCQFEFVKARYKGLDHNDNKRATIFYLAIIVRAGQVVLHRVNPPMMGKTC